MQRWHFSVSCWRWDTVQPPRRFCQPAYAHSRFPVHAVAKYERLQKADVTLYLAREIAASFAIGAMILLAPIIVTYLILLEVLFYRLRHHFPQHYKEIGEPSLFLNNSISKGSAMVRYLLDRDYRDLQDERTHRMGESARRLFLAATGVFSLALVAFATLALMLMAFS